MRPVSAPYKLDSFCPVGDAVDLRRNIGI